MVFDKEKEFLENFNKPKVLQKCPKCGELSLQYSDGKLFCTKCPYSEDIGSHSQKGCPLVNLQDIL